MKPPRKGSGKYRKGYWLSSDDVGHVMTAMFGDDTVRPPLAYDHVARRMGVVVQRVKDLMAKGKQAQADEVKRDFGWGKWTTQVTNCGASGGKGTHWVLTSTYQSANPEAIIWEPLDSPVYAADAKNALEGVCGPEKVASHIMAQQHDGWSCGYIAAWWALHQHLMHADAAVMDTPPEPPTGWLEIVWLICLAQKKGLKASGLGLRPIMDRAWDGINVDFVPAIMDHLEALLRG